MGVNSMRKRRYRGNWIKWGGRNDEKERVFEEKK